MWTLSASPARSTPSEPQLPGFGRDRPEDGRGDELPPTPRAVRSRLVVVVGLLGVALAACGGSGSKGDGAASPTTSTENHRDASGPAPADQQGRIAFRRFLTDDESEGVVFTSTPQDTDERRLSRPPASAQDAEPDWAPDATHLLFTRIRAEGTDHESHQLFTAASTGKELTRLTPNCRARAGSVCGFEGSGAFSRDGKSIAFVHAEGKVANDQIQHSDIFVMDANGKHRRQISTSRPYAGDAQGVQWSPDGKQLVFGRSSAPGSRSKSGRALFTVNTNGTKQRRLTPWSLGADGTPDWSPRTNLIVLRAVADEELGQGNFFTIHPDGTGLTQITHFADAVISHKVGFSPSGQWIVFGKIGVGGTHNDVFIARTDGSGLRPVTKTQQEEGSPDWSPKP
jgi:Tol biopolymer transport system component